MQLLVRKANSATLARYLTQRTFRSNLALSNPQAFSLLITVLTHTPTIDAICFRVSSGSVVI